MDKSLQTTRRFDALKLWLTLRIMGPDCIGDYFDAAIDLAQRVHEELLDMPDLEVAVAPSLSTLVFRYRPEQSPAEGWEPSTPGSGPSSTGAGTGWWPPPRWTTPPGSS